MKRTRYMLIGLTAFGAMMGVGMVVLAVRTLSTTAAASGDSMSRGTVAIDPKVRQAIVDRGQSVMRVVAAGDSRDVFAQFDSQMAAAVPLSQIQQVIGQVGTVGDCLGESARVGDENSSIYIASYQWNGRQLSAVITFDQSGKIAGFQLRPEDPLPPDPEAGYRTKGAYRLPFDGAWSVLWGGNTLVQNYHAAYVDQRHAYDIDVQRNGASHHGDASKLVDYYAFGQTIHSPADATVDEAVDGLPDNVPGVMDPERAAGNHVILDCGNGEYIVMAHFKDHSLRVHAGDHVRAGEPIALCGNSGNTSEPHLHIQLQNGPHLFQATGLPLEFTALLIDGKSVAKAELVQGEEVQNAPR